VLQRQLVKFSHIEIYPEKGSVLITALAEIKAQSKGLEGEEKARRENSLRYRLR
jgi:hypothetical protein